MIDSTVIHIKAGDGGDGAVSFRREKFAPNGGPDGGDGGSGGDVILVADGSISTLQKFQYGQRFTAISGGDGLSQKRHGADAGDVIVPVPVGTEVWDVTVGSEQRDLLIDLEADGASVVIARGGRGGRGNVMYVSPQNQEPLLAEAGERGEARDLRLELKLLADVGVIGMPNAGKSSLLTALTGAHPKIASYPFTTLEPSLGVLKRRSDALVLVEIPGLIEGASAGVGLGHDFLRHIERTRLLVHLVDGTEADIVERVKMINAELAAFDSTLRARRQVLVVNKSDIAGVPEAFAGVKSELALIPGASGVLCVSAATHDGLAALSDVLFRHLTQDGRDAPIASSGKPAVLRPAPGASRPIAEKTGGAFRVLHQRAVRVARASDLRRYEAQVQFHHLLERLGVVQALTDLGVRTGDTVYVDEVEFEWS